MEFFDLAWDMHKIYVSVKPSYGNPKLLPVK